MTLKTIHASKVSIRVLQPLFNNKPIFIHRYSATAWDVDRREALKQLYSDYDMSPGVKQKAPNTEFRRQLSAGKTPVRNENLQGPPVKSFGRDGQVNNNGGAHAPSKHLYYLIN
jgi:hypothetical protein